ncbi:hypothetical protein [Jatrophihabitans sp.]|uniref:hypothetical protein n=1 Tax=Jatrophihabitans sp. TaxID=1932789 RepID=UPI002BAA2539|nr:hypothetical protein [Jatrophihabitans sp.]
MDAGAPRHTTGTLPAAAVSTPRPKPSPSATTLTKAQFVTKMEAVCADFDTRIQAVTNSKDPKTVAGIVTVTQTILTLYPQYLKQADALVGRSSDKATLTRNWLRLEKSDFAGVEPVLKRYLADVKALDSDAVAVDAKVLDALPDHSEAIAGFMSGYGLKKCAALQSS